MSILGGRISVQRATEIDRIMEEAKVTTHSAYETFRTIQTEVNKRNLSFAPNINDNFVIVGSTHLEYCQVNIPKFKGECFLNIYSWERDFKEINVMLKIPSKV